jgi:hypothetical protein
MQITSRPMPLPDYSKYPSYPDVTPEQINQARNQALDKKDEVQAQSEAKATARRTMAVSYTAYQQDKAVVERYLQASGQESSETTAPSSTDIYRMENRYQRQQVRIDYLQYRQSPLGKQLEGMTGAEDRKGNLLDTSA